MDENTVLVALPIHSGFKGFYRWVEAYMKFTYENKSLVIACSDPSWAVPYLCEMAEQYKGFSYTYLPFTVDDPSPLRPVSRRFDICEGRETIRKYAVTLGVPWLLWIDSDLVCPPNTVELMLSVAKREKADLAYTDDTGLIMILSRDAFASIHIYSSISLRADIKGNHPSVDCCFVQIVQLRNFNTCGMPPHPPYKIVHGPYVPNVTHKR